MIAAIITYFSINTLFILFHLNCCKTLSRVNKSRYQIFYVIKRKTWTENWRNVIFAYICRTEEMLGDSRQEGEK